MGSCGYGYERRAVKLRQPWCVSEPTLCLCTASYQSSPQSFGSFITADMSSSHFGVHSSYLRVLDATDAHVLLDLTLLQFYLGYLETHFICEHKKDQSSPAILKHKVLWFTHISSTLLLGGLGSQQAPFRQPHSGSCLPSWHLPFRACLISLAWAWPVTAES